MSDPVVLLSTGDVVGPAGGVTDNSMVLFSGTSGKLIKGNNAQVTSAGLALLDDIDANAQLTTLGLTTTQPQFDNSVKQATTEFVQRALGNFQTTLRSVPTTLPATNAGSYHSLEGPSTYTLPALSSVPLGATYKFTATIVGAAVSTAGADAILLGDAPVTSIPLNNGDSVHLVAAQGTWIAFGGSAALRASRGDFGSSLASSGYQKLPSGLIIQWGSAVTTGGVVVPNFPIAFPNNCFWGGMCIASASFLGQFTPSVGNTTLTTIQLIVSTGASVGGGVVGVRWLAIGN